MNFLEELAAEWYEYTGHFVRTNVRTRKREKGGWDVELDVLAYAPGDGTLWHIETSGDSESWEQRKQRFLQKKFVLSHREYEQAIGSKISSIKKLAVVGQTRTAKASLDWGGDIEVVLIPQFVQRVATVLRKRDPMSEAVPEGYPLLRSMQMALAYGMERT